MAVVEKGWRWLEQRELLPPDLSEWQINEVDDSIGDYEDDLRAAGPEATAVILRRLAAVVVVPDRDDPALMMEIYLDELQGYPEHILEDACQVWRADPEVLADHQRVAQAVPRA